MKLHCNVEVHNRALPSVSQRKSQRSILTIGRQSDKDDLCIVLQTLQNKKGTKYKVLHKYSWYLIRDLSRNHELYIKLANIFWCLTVVLIILKQSIKIL